MHAMKRREFNEQVILGGEFSPDSAADAALIASSYPKNSSAAAGELRTRGLAVKPETLRHLIRDGVIPDSSRRTGAQGRNRAWTADDLDRVAEILDRERVYTPSGYRCFVDGTNLGDEVRAMNEAQRRNPDLNPDLFVRVVLPGAIGLNVPAFVQFRTMTDAEHAERQRRINAAGS